MSRIGRGATLVAIPLALLAFAAVASAGTSKHSTRIVVRHVGTSASGRIFVTGIVRSDSRRCRSRFLSLMEKMRGQDDFIDGGLSSFGGGWGLRSAPDRVNNHQFYVLAGRDKEHIVEVSPNAQRTRHRTIICKADREPVELPAS
jgi:hypothetical protein